MSDLEQDRTDDDMPGASRRHLLAGAATTLVGGAVLGAGLAPGVASADVPAGSVLLSSLSAEVKDPAPAIAGARSLGTGPQQAAPGDVVGDLTTSIPIA